MKSFLAAVHILFLCSFAVRWFLPPSSVGIGDWDWVFSDAWLSTTGLVERGWPALWSIQIAGGAPLAGNPESLAYSPLLLFPLALGPILGTKVLVVLLIVAGLVGCHRLGLRWIGDPVGSAVFAFVFVFSGYFAIHFRAGHFPWATFYLVPWILLFIDRLLFDPTPSLGGSLGLLVSLVLLFSGTVYHPLVFFLLPVAAIYGVVNGRDASRNRVRHVLLLVLCAVALTMPRWLAVIDWQWHSPRTVQTGHGGMPLIGMAEMLLTPVKDYKTRVRFGGSGVWEYWSYVGIIASILAIVSVLTQERLWNFARLCIGGAVILAWRGPWGNGLEWLSSFVPVLGSVRVYSRFLVLGVFAMALLAGGGVGALRSRLRGRFAGLPFLLLLAMVGDYWLVVRPIWSKVFALPPAEVYSDWAVSLEGPPYTMIRSVPYVQDFTDDQDNFNSRMLPLLMAGAVVRNPYVTLNGVPWMPTEGKVVESLPEASYQLRNHRLEFWGDFREGQEIAINLQCPRHYWRVADRSTARIQRQHGAIKLVILKPCQYLLVTIRTGLETAGWVVSGIGIVLAAAVLWRERALGRRDNFRAL